VKLLAFLGGSFVLLLLVIAWPALRSDWRYWSAERAFHRLQVGESKERVRASFGLPPFTLASDHCWYDVETLWPTGARRYTLCFSHGRLASKTYEDD
jgi:hypothetical protein